MRLKSVIRVSMYIRELMTLTQCTVDAEKDVGMKKLKLEEAITILQDMKVDIPVPKAAVMQTKRNVALDMAIDVLKCSEMPNSSQCINRQAAIDALCSECQGRCRPCENYPCGEVEAINALPSAQPQIIRCKDCKWFGDIGCAIEVIDDSDRPTETDFCSFAERRTDEDD